MSATEFFVFKTLKRSTFKRDPRFLYRSETQLRLHCTSLTLAVIVGRLRITGTRKLTVRAYSVYY